MRRRLLPFYDERKSKIDMIVLHSVAFEPEEAIRAFIDAKVSSHYVIGSDGEVWQLVGQKHRAWHAGKSWWRGTDDLNSHSIGIELCSPTLGQMPFTPAQKKALKPLLKCLISKYNIRPENIVGHSDIAPSRKPDPGKAFFWQELAQEGIGWWPDCRQAGKIGESSPQKLLAIIGYDTSDVGAAAYAFCRRFLPDRVAVRASIEELIGCPGAADDTLLGNDEFLTVLKAAAYKYLNESKTPCKI